VSSYWLILDFGFQGRLSEQFSGLQTAFGTTFRDTGGYQKAGTSSVKRVTESNFIISK